jgi:hypothetical protein
LTLSKSVASSRVLGIARLLHLLGNLVDQYSGTLVRRSSLDLFAIYVGSRDG